MLTSVSAGVTLLVTAAGTLKMPEPLLGESITDLDSRTAGELEFDLDGAYAIPGATRGAWATSVEAEGRVTRRLGLSAEAELDGPASSLTGGARLGASWALFHDAARHLHVQVEASARLPDAEAAGSVASAELGDPALPFAGGVRAGIQWGMWTLRAALGGEFGAPSAHLVPLRAGLALLASLGPEGGYGFAGLDGIADWGRRSPFVLAPTIGLHGGPLDAPTELLFAAPIRFGSGGESTAVGVAARLVIEFDLFDADDEADD